MDGMDKSEARFVLLGSVALALLLAGGGEGCPKRSQNIAIMMTSDLQSVLLPVETVVDGQTVTLGGFERIAAAAQSVRDEVDGALLLSSGDDLIPPMLTFLHGEPEMRGMTLAAYDGGCPGNHEFDAGLEVYKEALGFAGFDIVCANLSFDDPDVAQRVVPWTIERAGCLRVGIFGLMTPELLRLTSLPGGGVNVDADFIGAAKKAVRELECRRVDLVVAVTHLGVTLDRQLADAVSGIDVIVGGHDHTYVYETRGNTIILQAGMKGRSLGILRFAFERGRMVDPTWEDRPLDESVGADPEIHDLMAQYQQEYEAGLGQEIGESLVDLDARIAFIRTGETNLGDMIADSWLDWFPHADAALVNSGSIRGDEVYPAGPITYLTVNEILAFRNEIVLATMTGAQLRQVLEISASALRVDGDDVPDEQRAPTGGFLQVAGLRVTFDASQAPFCAVYDGHEVTQVLNPGLRVTSLEVRSGGGWVTVEDGASYEVLINDWAAQGGDGHYVFLDPSVVLEDTTMISTDVLGSYIQRNTPVAPTADGRIQVSGLGG